MKKSLAVLIREGRKAKGWNQQKLADEAGLSQFYVSQIERGAKPTIQTAEKLAEILEINKLTAAELVKKMPSASDRVTRDERNMIQAIRNGDRSQVESLLRILMP